MSNRKTSTVRISVMAALGLAWAGAVACSNGPSSGNASDAGPQYYNTTSSTMTSASSSKGPYSPPMNFIDGQVIVTYPEAGAGDGSSETDSASTADGLADAPDSPTHNDAMAPLDAAADVADASESDGGG